MFVLFCSVNNRIIRRFREGVIFSHSKRTWCTLGIYQLLDVLLFPLGPPKDVVIVMLSQQEDVVYSCRNITSLCYYHLVVSDNQ